MTRLQEEIQVLNENINTLQDTLKVSCSKRKKEALGLLKYAKNILTGKDTSDVEKWCIINKLPAVYVNM